MKQSRSKRYNSRRTQHKGGKKSSKQKRYYGERIHQYTERDKIEKGGIYAYLPFDNTSDGTTRGRSMYKIGYTTNFALRESNYHTYLPEGVYRVALLIEPTVGRPSKKGDTNKDKLRRYFTTVEKAIFNEIVEQGGEILNSDSRKNNQGDTEWIYATETQVKNAFTTMKGTYGGDLKLYELNKAFPDRTNKKSFTGEIYFQYKDEIKK
jgi:hypothetical protein